MTPNMIKITFLLLALAYVFFPFDLLPDLLGILGYIDDLVVLALLYWKYKRVMARWQQYGSSPEAESNSRQKAEELSSAQTSKGSFEPHKILNVLKGASQAEIEAAYRKLAVKYHPDKVSHLGREFQDLAHEKMIGIQKAYEMLKN